jgi:hypothetical protein
LEGHKPLRLFFVCWIWYTYYFWFIHIYY